MAAHLSPHAFAFFSHSAFFLASTFLVFASVALLMQAVFSAAHLSLQSFRFFSTLAQETKLAIKTAAIMTIIVLFIKSSSFSDINTNFHQPCILFKKFFIAFKVPAVNLAKKDGAIRRDIRHRPPAGPDPGPRYHGPPQCSGFPH